MSSATMTINAGPRSADAEPLPRRGSASPGPSRAHVLIVDDEPDILDLLTCTLEREGYRVSCALDGEQALSNARAELPDLIVLDLMLPGMDGWSVCRALKSSRETDSIPILILSARSEDADIVSGLELGADDYVSKPFSPRVLLGRIRALLRRKNELQNGDAGRIVKIAGVAINPVRHETRVDDQPVDLTVTEFRILHTLASRPGWVYSRERIVDAARGSNVVVTHRSVDVHVARLRRKLGRYGSLIQTVRGLGYRLSDPDT